MIKCVDFMECGLRYGISYQLLQLAYENILFMIFHYYIF